MKRNFVIGLIAALLLLVMVPAVAGDEKKCDKKEVAKACCSKSSCLNFHGCKNAKMEVKNVEDGVVIKITAEKAEDVKAIQECAAKCKSHSEKCAKGDKKASCAKTCSKEQQAKCAAAAKEKGKADDKKAAGCQHGKEKKDA
jgi:hypothetical protein